ncbi:AVN_HP_G0119770.mRNA.1.CDS.1 [Saccharomyces cerevisiae]|nr:AVN_HP_G0119770.mRNA.1.CDS.1 [Saccharomyces cerevisiae]CAI6996890.1 AVN_HP_G0119770.mRNA.1.CDS.1 [Saccharomyces cerevisiae]
MSKFSKWFSEAPFNVYAAQQKIFKEQDVYADGRILDIRGVEIVSAVIGSPRHPSLGGRV